MKQEKQFRQTEQQQLSETQAQSQVEKKSLEFASPEELLRYDAKQTLVPPGIAQRLSRARHPDRIRQRE